MNMNFNSSFVTLDNSYLIKDMKKTHNKDIEIILILKIITKTIT